METAVLFATKFWAWFSIIIGSIFFLRPDLLKKTYNLVREESYLLTTGFIALLLGLISVLTCNIWALDLRLFATIFGWASLIKGILLIGYPEFFRKSALLFVKKLAIAKFLMLFLIVLGIWVIWAL